MKKIVQINLKYKVTRPELEKAFLELAQSLSDSIMRYLQPFER